MWNSALSSICAKDLATGSRSRICLGRTLCHDFDGAKSVLLQRRDGAAPRGRGIGGGIRARTAAMQNQPAVIGSTRWAESRCANGSWSTVSKDNPARTAGVYAPFERIARRTRLARKRRCGPGRNRKRSARRGGIVAKPANGARLRETHEAECSSLRRLPTQIEEVPAGIVEPFGFTHRRRLHRGSKKNNYPRAINTISARCTSRSRSFASKSHERLKPERWPWRRIPPANTGRIERPPLRAQSQLARASARAARGCEPDIGNRWRSRPKRL